MGGGGGFRHASHLTLTRRGNMRGVPLILTGLAKRTTPGFSGVVRAFDLLLIGTCPTPFFCGAHLGTWHELEPWRDIDAAQDGQKKGGGGEGSTTARNGGNGGRGGGRCPPTTYPEGD